MITVRQLINILEKQDPDMPVVIKSNSRFHVDDFVDLVSDDINVVQARKIDCPVAERSTYDASIHAKVDTEIVSLNGKAITRP